MNDSSWLHGPVFWILDCCYDYHYDNADLLTSKIKEEMFLLITLFPLRLETQNFLIKKKKLNLSYEKQKNKQFLDTFN